MTANHGVMALTAAKLDELLQQQPIIFVDFWAQWCAPCTQLALVYERVALQYPEITFAAINIEHESALADELNIRSIPHLMVFKQGIAIYSESGTVPESILHELVQQALAADVSKIRQQLDAGIE